MDISWPILIIRVFLIRGVACKCFRASTSVSMWRSGSNCRTIDVRPIIVEQNSTAALCCDAAFSSAIPASQSSFNALCEQVQTFNRKSQRVLKTPQCTYGLIFDARHCYYQIEVCRFSQGHCDAGLVLIAANGYCGDNTRQHRFLFTGSNCKRPLEPRFSKILFAEYLWDDAKSQPVGQSYPLSAGCSYVILR